MKESKKWILVMLILACVHLPRILKAGELISTEIVGKGSPMILIHGMSCSANVWDDVVEQLKSEYELHVVTIAGFGNKESVDAPHLLQAVRDELIEYIESKRLQKPILMGHSMGGFLSLWIAAVKPALVGKVVSVDGIPYFPAIQMPGATPETAKYMAEQMRTIMESMDDKTFRANQEMIVASMIATKDKREPVVQMGLNSNPKMTGQAFAEMYLTDIRETVKAIEVPVLVLGAWAAYKNFGATKESVTMGYQAQVQNIQKVEVAVADEAYHFIFYDEPEWFYQKVGNFLKG